jgi:SAM-dependent methyltransferase
LADQIARAAAEMCRSAADESRLLALGEMRVAQATIESWLDHAVSRLDKPVETLDTLEVRPICAECRIALARCSQQVAAAAVSAAGSRALVAGGALERARRDLDVFVLQHRLEPKLIELGAGADQHDADADPALRFDGLFAHDPDPWDYATSPYEHAKYAATLGALPPGELGRVLEVGCANGAFTSLLAPRCESLLAIDLSSRALGHAAARSLPGNVELRQAAIPEEVPEGTWDVIVCSEVLYYLKPDASVRTLLWLTSQLEAGAVVLVVSWRGHGAKEPMRGDDVHDLLTSQLGHWHVLDRRRPRYRLDRFDGTPRA